MDKHTQRLAHRVSVLIPAYNEGPRIKKLIRDVQNQFAGIDHHDYEIIVIDDGSDEGIEKTIRLTNSVTYVKIERNVGKGAALKRGFQYATGQICVFLDGDYQIHPQYIWRYINQLEKSKADVVIASKRHPQSIVDYPRLRRIVSDGYHDLVKFMFDIKLSDTQTGFKVFRTAVLKDVFPIVTSKLYAFDLEILLLAKKRGYKIIERPIEIMDVAKYNRFSIMDIYHTFKDTLSIWYRFYLKKSYVFHSYHSKRVESESK